MQFSRATSSMVGPVIGSSCILCTLLGYIRVFAEIGTLRSFARFTQTLQIDAYLQVLKLFIERGES